MVYDTTIGSESTTNNQQWMTTFLNFATVSQTFVNPRYFLWANHSRDSSLFTKEWGQRFRSSITKNEWFARKTKERIPNPEFNPKFFFGNVTNLLHQLVSNWSSLTCIVKVPTTVLGKERAEPTSTVPWPGSTCCMPSPTCLSLAGCMIQYNEEVVHMARHTMTMTGKTTRDLMWNCHVTRGPGRGMLGLRQTTGSSGS